MISSATPTLSRAHADALTAVLRHTSPPRAHTVHTVRTHAPTHPRTRAPAHPRTRAGRTRSFSRSCAARSSGVARASKSWLTFTSDSSKCSTRYETCGDARSSGSRSATTAACRAAAAAAAAEGAASVAVGVVAALPRRATIWSTESSLRSTLSRTCRNASTRTWHAIALALPHATYPLAEAPNQDCAPPSLRTLTHAP